MFNYRFIDIPPEWNTYAKYKIHQTLGTAQYSPTYSFSVQSVLCLVCSQKTVPCEDFQAQSA